LNWTVQTNAGALAARTNLHFVEQTIAGTAPSNIQVDDTFSVEFADNTRSGGKVTSRNGNTVVIEMKDKSVWTLTPHNSDDYPVGIDSPGLHFQNWVVR
jgi:hypothetical protein